VEKTIKFGHFYSEDFVLKLVDKMLTCPNYKAHLDIHAKASVKAELSYGFTIIAKLGAPLDCSDLYLYFHTRGEITAAFIVNMAITYHFKTLDITLFAVDKFGAIFTVPGIVTIRPNFKVSGKLEGVVTLGVNFKTYVKLGGWDI
jgi:chitinase